MRAAIITIVAAVLVGVVVYLLNSQPGPPTNPDTAATRPTAQLPTHPTQGGDAPRRPVQATPDTGVQPGYYQQFLASNDLWAFAEQMHRMALEGDDAAQFWLFRALRQCGEYYDSAFDVDPDDPHPMTVQEAVQREKQSPRIGAATVERLYAQCTRLRTPEAAKFGKADVWLEKAAGGGFPQAQIWSANELLEAPGSERRDSPRTVTRARELTLAALRSGDASPRANGITACGPSRVVCAARNAGRRRTGCARTARAMRSASRTKAGSTSSVVRKARSTRSWKRRRASWARR
jgi:hypothetical protein